MSDSKNPNVKEIERMVESISEWLYKQPHLPHIEDKELLKKFLVNSKCRLQKTKTKIENYYSARTKFPSVYQNRDPTAPEIRKAAKQAHFFLLSQPTKNGDGVVIVKMTGDHGDLNPTDVSKLMFMKSDVMFMESTGKLGYIVVMDFRGFTFQQFLCLSTEAKLFMDVVQNVLPCRLKGIHYVHAPSFINRVVELIKMLIAKPKLKERIQVHKDIHTLYEAIGDRDILPCDLGGRQPPIAELNDQFQKKLESYKSWFEKEENIRSNEDLRPPSCKNSWLFGVEGSFKKLNVD